MQILTYPVGVVVGLLPVVVELGAPPRPASLLLDGRPACTFVSEASTCVVDLGSAPKVHVLELVRKGPAGNVVERAVRWVNRPGAAEAEVQTRTRCPEGGGRCSVRVGWAHPERQNPKKISVALDGKRAATTRNRDVSLDVAGTRGSILTVDLVFPDGRRATHASVLGGRVHGDEDTAITANLDAGACGPDGPAAAAARRRAAGENVRAAERGEAEIVVVAEPAAYGALARLVGPAHVVPKPPDRVALDDILRKAGFTVHVVVADRRLARGELQPKEPVLDAILETLDATPLRPVRLADAVASAALHVGVPGNRRLVVLVAAEGAEDSSALGAAGVRAYLDEIRVPLAVWRMQPAARPDWPEGRTIATVEDFRAALLDAKERLDCQAVVWIEPREEKKP
ncbi:MAG: hypothetical protein IPL89_13895 [Acidobacteria bacterium]|nr:hypothetical protein [Acidobacteriota bacterium]